MPQSQTTDLPTAPKRCDTRTHTRARAYAPHHTPTHRRQYTKQDDCQFKSNTQEYIIKPLNMKPKPHNGSNKNIRTNIKRIKHSFLQKCLMYGIIYVQDVYDTVLDLYIASLYAQIIDPPLQVNTFSI